MPSRELLPQWEGYGLTTAEIHYRLLDHPALLQLYVWQDYDVAPDSRRRTASSIIGSASSTGHCIRSESRTSASFGRPHGA